MVYLPALTNNTSGKTWKARIESRNMVLWEASAPVPEPQCVTPPSSPTLCPFPHSKAPSAVAGARIQEALCRHTAAALWLPRAWVHSLAVQSALGTEGRRPAWLLGQGAP